MALSANERKKRQLEREREEARKLPDSALPYLRTPFYLHLQRDDNWSSVEFLFALMGMEAPFFEDDRGPEQFCAEECFRTDEDRDEALQGAKGSLGRAELFLGVLLDSAMELSHIINRYKRGELERRLRELQTADLSDPVARKQALEQAAHIAKLQDHLSKNVRRTFAQWQIKGI